MIASSSGSQDCLVHLIVLSASEGKPIQFYQNCQGMRWKPRKSWHWRCSGKRKYFSKHCFNSNMSEVFYRPPNFLQGIQIKQNFKFWKIASLLAKLIQDKSHSRESCRCSFVCVGDKGRRKVCGICNLKTRVKGMTTNMARLLPCYSLCKKSNR